MGILVSCQSISKSFSSRPLFQNISLGLEEGDKLGLIGPNGTGKSTFAKILTGLLEPDNGAIVLRRQLRIAYQSQNDSFDSDCTVEQIVSQAADTAVFEDHARAASIDATLTRVGFHDRQARVGTLSGGWRRRLALAAALVKKPELLLLDEPTNHLDLDSILWLEALLKSANFSYVIITHDRAFLESVTNRIVELNPIYPLGFLSVKGNYSQFLLAREEQVNAQRNLQQALASKVRREIAWLQRGARARQTKAQGHIQQAERLIDELAQVRQRNAMTGAVEISFDASGRKSKELLVAKKISKAYGDRLLFSDLSFVLSPGTKLGLVGRNGSGKTTLLKLIVGELEPEAGTIKRADELKIVWFDQNREQLDQTLTLRQALSSAEDSVVYRGRSLHITSWAKKFLFRTDQLSMPLSKLSGGEQARILIANLMLRSADLLILDEPTNDLDIASLEVLEESLEDFPGAVILVTHDRMMLDTVSNQILALDGKGTAQFFASYEQFEPEVERFFSPASPRLLPLQQKPVKATKPSREGLSTAEKRELATMTDKIEQVEAKMAALQLEMGKPHVSSNYGKLQELIKQEGATRKELETLFARWEELETKASKTT